MTDKEIENLKFMSIGSNCYGMAYMGEQRVRGPIDNFLAMKGFSSTITLFEGTIENEILNTKPKEFKGSPRQFEVTFLYDNFWIVHIDLPDHWFIYNLGQFDIKFSDGIGKGLNTQEPTDYFLKGLEYIKSLGILNKIIFVGNVHSEPRKDFAKFNSKIVKNMVPYHVDIIDIQMRQPENNRKDFIQYLKEINY